MIGHLGYLGGSTLVSMTCLDGSSGLGGLATAMVIFPTPSPMIHFPTPMAHSPKSVFVTKAFALKFCAEWSD